MSAISKRIVREMRDKEFRDEYVASRVKRWIATQIRSMRTQKDRGWSQKQLAERLGTAQSNVSRFESPDYGQFTLQTLLDMAAAFDVALQVRFVDHITFLIGTSDLSPDRLEVRGYDRKLESTMARMFNAPIVINYTALASNDSIQFSSSSANEPDMQSLHVSTSIKYPKYIGYAIEFEGVAQ
jgi:transcriptional regulator with XRE-family HTH domain